VNKALLRDLPLPAIDGEGDKESRGRVLVIGGSASVPGAMLLSGVAALRAGAGKLQLATVRDAAIALGFAVPEAMVIALPRGHDGEIGGGRVAALLRPHVEKVDAVLVGPGMMSDAGAYAVIRAIIPALNERAVLVLDGVASVALRHDRGLLHPLGGRAVLTPHGGEMASLLGIDRAEIVRDAQRLACRASRDLCATVALKGAETWIAEHHGQCLHFDDGAVGLGTSGSGDTLAGIVVGLAARGAPPLTAAAWGVWAHAMAGQALARRTARIGFLARELLAEVPALVGE
jgi:hydroxyethylthiazole kinase-like uncharacterized protein yjeF